MRFPGCEFGFENSQWDTPKPAAPAPAYKRRSKRRASSDPDRVWQVLVLIVIGVLLAIGGFIR